jgi:hypothetical protein
MYMKKAPVVLACPPALKKMLHFVVYGAGLGREHFVTTEGFRVLAGPKSPHMDGQVVVFDPINGQARCATTWVWA